MSSAPPVVISTNHLLAALPRNEYKQLLASCVETEIVLGEVLYRSGDLISHVYFPTTSIISLVAPPCVSIVVGVPRRRNSK